MLETLKQHIVEHGFNITYWLAYSGGVDSHVLLHLMAQLRKTYPLTLRAVYINHNLSPHAEQWAQHAEKICADLNITFQQQKISNQAVIGESPEDIARERRYETFAAFMAHNDCLLTAHHQNDQAETVLLQLIRGAGPKGLSGMPQKKKFAAGFHLRPLLNFTREELVQYAEQHKLHWIEDESNANTKFARNFLRREVLPLLQKRWPSITKTLSRAAKNCAQTELLLADCVADDLAFVLGERKNSLSVRKLLSLNPLRQQHVLRLWLRELDFPLPSAIKLQKIQENILSAQADKSPCVSWKNIEARRYRDQLYVMESLVAHNAEQVVVWNLAQPLKLQNLGMLNTRQVQGDGLRADIREVTIRFRQGGERFCLPGRTHHHELKKLFQVWGVLPWQRDRVPLIYVGDTLAAVAGYMIADEFIAKKDEVGLLIDCDFLLH